MGISSASHHLAKNIHHQSIFSVHRLFFFFFFTKFHNQYSVLLLCHKSQFTVGNITTSIFGTIEQFTLKTTHCLKIEQKLSMDNGCTSFRRLSFEHANEEHNQYPSDMVDDGSMNQLVNLTSTNDKEDTPKIGMSFDTEEDVYEFYLKYSKRVGFGIRRSKSHKNKSGELVDRIFCCSAQGKRSHDKRDIYVKKARPETRFDCQAKLKVSSRETRKLCVVQFC
ncbi:protein FAR1-RELATED SEQUENCE 6-like [Salvia miltiorrhiza]|uniref:protein FAR1-RELATED SEQUENCE 6-like n=1 Tax=Salvia miltiorrhiza TaxID=226208 RepID=UPI0025AD7F1F|nr:protein FAR1-RELATED SEQUENCE 6-like [Salvia miltiorrhiza]